DDEPDSGSRTATTTEATRGSSNGIRVTDATYQLAAGYHRRHQPRNGHRENILSSPRPPVDAPTRPALHNKALRRLWLQCVPLIFRCLSTRRIIRHRAHDRTADGAPSTSRPEQRRSERRSGGLQGGPCSARTPIAHVVP